MRNRRPFLKIKMKFR